MLQNLFILFELFLFIIPIIPSSRIIRLSIMLFYFVSHVFGVQHMYAKFKKSKLKY